jgi:phosphatidylglycerophosphate synthase
MQHCPFREQSIIGYHTYGPEELVKVERMTKTPSISEIRKFQDLSKLRVPLFTRYVCIPLALPLTVLALKLNLTPNKVSFARLFIALVALVLMSRTNMAVFWAGIVLFFVFVIMDSVDGNIARVTDKASYYGKFLDGFIDNLGDFLFPLALSIHVYRTDGYVDSVYAAAISSMALAMTFTILNRNSMIELSFESREGRPASSLTDIPEWLATFVRGKFGRALEIIDIHGMNVSFDLRYFGFIVAGVLLSFREYLYFVAILNVVVALFYITYRMVRAYCYLNVWRRSRSARQP